MSGANGNGAGTTPVWSTGWGATETAFGTGGAFWNVVADMRPGAELADAMDAAMVGCSAPRVWLILHEPGQPEMAATAALGLVRELARREQAVLLLDGDDRTQSLTTWAGRLESEGWIDVVRFGSSVLTAGVPLPLDGRRAYLLGVGSFAPTDVTPEEITTLLGRLRRQADDLIVVAPADDQGGLWAPAAGIRLLCWDRASRPATAVEALAADMADRGTPLTGMLGFGLSAPAPSAVEEAAPEAEKTAAQATDNEAPVDAAETEPDLGAPAAMDPPAEPEPRRSPAAEKEAVAAPVPDADPAPEAWSDDDGGWEEAPSFAEPEPQRGGTSGVFWFLATASVIIVAILGAYWYRYVRVPSDGHFAPVAVEARQETPAQEPGDRADGDLANADDPVGPPPGAAADTTAAGPAALPDTAAAEPVTAQTDTMPSSDPGATVAADGGDEGTTTAATDVPPADAAAAAEPGFTMDPYLDTVGAAGWALHLYSFPDSSGADVELAELHRRGFVTEVRVVETLDKGRWWRIYVGSFGDRAEAREAAPLLKEKLRTDWANPTRF